MRIERDEEQPAIRWLKRHGEAPGVIGLHAWVSALDAGARKALGQYLRLRRHRLHAPKVALEITSDVHASLSEYVIREGSVSLGEAIGRLLSAPHATTGRSAPPVEIQALREALVKRDKEVADLRRSLAAIQQALPQPATRGKRTETLPVAVAPPCPLCSGQMRPEFANGSRLWVWVCMTTTPSECAGTRPLDADLALSAALLSADWAQVWRHAKGRDAATAASVVKRTVAALERTVQEHARYWSAGEVDSIRAAATALDKLAGACEQIP